MKFMRCFCTSRLAFNSNRIKGLLTTLPKDILDHLNTESIVSYPTLLDLQAALKLNKQLLKDQKGVYIFTNLKDQKQYVGQSINQRTRLLVHIRLSENPTSRIANAIKKHGLHNFTGFPKYV